MKIRLFLALSFCLLGTGSLKAWDRDEIMGELLDTRLHPRILTSIDVPEQDTQNPLPLFSPEGEFTRDGSTQVAISGIYDLSQEPKRYFLLVATTDRKPRSLFFDSYDKPVFIHQRGTTGEGDPQDQSLSISFCFNCADGFDFYWNKKTQRFDKKAWKTTRKRLQKVVTTPAEEIPEAVVNQALKLVGPLPDVQKHVAELKKVGGTLGTRVRSEKNSKSPDLYVVTIVDKNAGKETIYDEITVDIKEKRVVGRKKQRRYLSGVK